MNSILKKMDELKLPFVMDADTPVQGMGIASLKQISSSPKDLTLGFLGSFTPVYGVRICSVQQ